MRIMLLLLLSALSMGCAQLVPDRVDAVASGTATVEATVSLRVLDQLHELCADQLGATPYPTEKERRAAVATCTFEHLSNIGGPSSALTQFATTYCGSGANLVGLTQEQVTSIAATCAVIGR